MDRSIVERGATETVLRLLAAQRPQCVALIVSVAGRQVVVEDSSAGRGPGGALHLPEGLALDRACVFEAAGVRLSLGWTQLCAWRPEWFVLMPLPDHGFHLLMLGAQERPAIDELASVAAMLSQLLRKAESTSRERETSSRIAALIDNLSLPIAFVDSRTVEVFLNGPARKLLGIQSEKASESEIAGAFGQLVVGAESEVGAHFAAEPKLDLVFDIEKAGQFFEVESRWIDDDRLSGRLWMFREVTMEREATRFKDELVSTVSHELRTPLTSINGSLGLLRGGAAGDLGDAASRLIDVAHRNGERLASLVDDLLDLDKLHAARLELNRTTVDMAALLREAVEQNEPYARRHDVRLALELPSWPISATVDPGRIVQVIGNLISNAAKFSPTDSVIAVRMGTYDHRLRISVSDQGPGISAEFQKRLFKRFAQADASGQKVGTGLGLAICKGIVEQHGGSIAYDPEGSTGATFNVDLPLGAGSAGA